MELAGIDCTVHIGLIEYELIKAGIDLNPSTATDEERNNAAATTTESFKATMMLENANPRRFKSLWTDLHNSGTPHKEQQIEYMLGCIDKYLCPYLS